MQIGIISVKILHMLDSIEYSGAEVMLGTAAPFLIRDGFKLHALSSGEDEGSYADILKSAGFSIHNIPFRRSVKYFVELLRFLNKEKFDIVHIHAERAFFWHVLVAKLAGVKKILRTVHNVFQFKGFLRFKRIFQRFIASKGFGVIFISIGPSVLLNENNFFFNRTIHISNWINPDKFYPIKDEGERIKAKSHMGMPDDATVIVSVGSCTNVKNHGDIIIAFANVSKVIENIYYIHVGAGPLEEYEKEQAKRLGVSGLINFVGNIENVREALIASDIFVMSSKYEGFGNSALEALCCGLPAVVYDVEGLRDIVVNGKNGILVDPSPGALSKAILELIMSERSRKKMGDKARNLATRRYHIEDSLKKMTDLYQNIP
jgi:glycosyltransferase involved in cell wall biosynthesis